MCGGVSVAPARRSEIPSLSTGPEAHPWGTSSALEHGADPVQRQRRFGQGYGVNIADSRMLLPTRSALVSA